MCVNKKRFICLQTQCSFYNIHWLDKNYLSSIFLYLATQMIWLSSNVYKKIIIIVFPFFPHSLFYSLFCFISIWLMWINQLHTGNLITIIALLQHQKLRGHATTAFVLSLCISDLLFCTISMPLTAIRYINKVSIQFWFWKIWIF